MDRLPREAALAGCVVITNREGAANFDDDVPLPSIFKFAQFNVDKICSLIKESCTKHGEYANANAKTKKLEKYREWILDQRVSTVYLYPIRLRYIIYARCNKNSNIPLNQTSTYLTGQNCLLTVKT